MNRVLDCDSLLKRNETESFLKRLITGEKDGLATTRTCEKNHDQKAIKLHRLATPTLNRNKLMLCVKSSTSADGGTSRYRGATDDGPAAPPKAPRDGGGRGAECELRRPSSSNLRRSYRQHQEYASPRRVHRARVRGSVRTLRRGPRFAMSAEQLAGLQALRECSGHSR
ncbi:hypothetical protein EVAR_74629_1 [Eumeta japonica]|uniref:Uncharacterized protein n=1 Tax=Eumeta variegata TaxID=151549 RepID=A0A4C1WD76_EUMVA|nr:hypothetical protein EVAR_74629_1 [Eumeta japonica]